ncbi:MAG: tRNA (adenosine(37)-N6)-threonylcarbamoyltransferase complex ATPase subunit type 1 TsaE [Actinomycetota bacterium]
MSEPTTVTVPVEDVAGTNALAASVAGSVEGGDVIVLTGDLGAGKTTFTKAFAAALDVTDPVTSPTFTLANRYEGRLVVHHLDAYRLAGPEEVVDLGLEELVDPGSVTLIEWGDRIDTALPGDRLDIALALGEPEAGDDGRILTLEATGPSWRRRLADLVAPSPSDASC